MNEKWLIATVNSHKTWIESAGEKGVQANFEGKDLQGLNLENLDLRYAIFKNSNLIRVKITNCQLQGSDFSGAHLNYSYSQDSDFSHSNLQNTNFEGSTIINSTFEYTKMNKTNFSKTKTRNVNFSYSKGEANNFKSAQLIGADFTNIIFTKTSFQFSNITNASFINAELIGNNLTGALGIPKKDEIIETKGNSKILLNDDPIFKLLTIFSNILYILSLTIFISIIALSLFKFIDNTSVDYLSWSIFLVSLAFLGTLSKLSIYLINKK